MSANSPPEKKMLDATELFEQKIKKLKNAIKKKDRLLENLKNDFQTCLEHGKLSHNAELLKVHFHLLKKGLSHVEVMDYYSDPPRTISIAIDPLLSPDENINNLFKLIKRSKRGLLHIEPRIIKTEKELSLLQEELEEFINKGVLGISETELAATPKSKKKKEKRLPYRVFAAADGNLFWTGRSAKDNDELLKFYTKGNEWWFHAKESSGSHVVLKNSSDAPHLELLIDGATLAAHFSKKKESSMEISYTRVKYVKKIKGMPAGMVSISNAKTLFIKNEEERLKRLLNNEIKAGF